MHRPRKGSGIISGNHKWKAAAGREYGSGAPAPENCPRECIAQRKRSASAERRLVHHDRDETVRQIGQAVPAIIVDVGEIGTADGSAAVHTLSVLDRGGGIVEFLRPGVIHFKLQSGL